MTKYHLVVKMKTWVRKMKNLKLTMPIMSWHKMMMNLNDTSEDEANYSKAICSRGLVMPDGSYIEQ